MRIGKLHLWFSSAHLEPDLHPTHGPAFFPWWKLFAVRSVALDVTPPSYGKRLWVYFRSGGAIYFDAYVDKRDHV